MLREILKGSEVVSKLSALKGCQQPVLVLFTATKKDDGTRWCPDCEASDPVIEEAVKNAPAGVHFYSVELTRDEWKVDPGKEHYLRKEPFNVQGIPTMLEWDCTEGKASKTFGETDLLQLESLSSYFLAFNDQAN